MIVKKRLLSENDKREIENFERFLHVAAFLQDECGMGRRKADEEACLTVYGNRQGEDEPERVEHV